MSTIRGDLPLRLARDKAVRAAVRQVAADVLTAARSRAASHRRAGTLAASLRVAAGRTDALIVSDDPHAVSKEYGHTAANGRPVDGLHILGGAATDVAGRR
jgi:hypothetical protein